MNHPFKLKNAALLMALAAIYPVTAHSAAGVAQFAIGDVNVRRGAASMPLAKGQSIDSGDNIVTGSAGQTQIRFTDGGLVSLAPNSQFNIDKYADENDPGKDSFAVSFLRGGMRAITGLIGKRKTDNYKVTTNTATIGIRGSAFSSVINPDGTMDVAGEQDGIVVCTNAGCVNLIVGEVVRVTNSNSLPSRTAQRSNVPPLVARDDLFVPDVPAEIQRGAESEIGKKVAEPPPPEVIVVTPPQQINGVLTGLSAMFAFGNSSFIDSYPRGGADPSDGQGTFVDGRMVRHTGTAYERTGAIDELGVAAPRVHALAGLANGPSIVEKTSTDAGTFGTVGTADDPGFIGWGYWDAGKVTHTGMQAEIALEPTEAMGVHYIVGRPTPQAQMPITGTANYALLGWTDPTAFDGETFRVGHLIDAKLNVDFSAARVNAAINTSFDNGAILVQIGGNGYIDGSTFYSDGSGSGFFSGFFTGAQASRAGLLYGINDATVGDVRGSAVFLNGGSGDAFNVQSGVAAMFTSASSDDTVFFDRAKYQNPSLTTGFFVGNQLYKHDDGEDTCCSYGGSSTIFTAHSPVSSFGSLGNPGDTDFIGWGYWAKGDYTGGSSITGVHYLVGRPTPGGHMPSTGTAKYNLAGGTAPTAYYNYGGMSILRVGRLDSAGLNVDFGNQRINGYINTSFENGTIPVQISAVGYVNGSFFYASDFGQGYFSGFFTGEQASRAGLIYQTYDNAVGRVQGAAVFTQGGTGDVFTDVARTTHNPGASGLAAMFISAESDSFSIYDDSPRGARGTYTGSALFIGSQLIDHHDNYSGGSSIVSARSPVTSSGALGNIGDADFIGWGYWAKGQSNGNVGNSNLTGVHYLVGRPTALSQMPVTGTANYSLAGGTSPTATDSGGTILVGSLLNTSNMSVNFGTATVNATINTQFTKAGVVVPVTVSDTAQISGSTFRANGCGFNGFFAGNQAVRAGLLYNKNDSTVGTVTGAAVFQKITLP